MGRKRTKHHHLPPHMAQKGKAYYYVTSTTPRQWIPLGKDLNQARLKWAELEQEPLDSKDKTFAVIAERYRREVLRLRALRTQKDYQIAMDKLVKVFGHIPVDAITPQDVREYMNLRGQKAPIRANREKAMLSTLFNYAREWGYTNAANPCAGVKGFKEAGRDRYVEDAEYLAVWNAASPPIQDAMDIAYLTGQRPADVLKMRLSDIRNGFLWVQQNKTGKKLRVEIVGLLKNAIERILSRPRPALGLSVIQNEKGQPLSVNQLRDGFERARKAAGVDFQFRDLRAKAATDLNDLHHAQKLLGHSKRDMTEHYTRQRIGETVKPVGAKSEKL
jgi:integrase